MLLVTERLLLHEFALEDWRAVHAYQNHPEFLRFYHWTTRADDDVRNLVGDIVRAQHEQPRTCYQLALTQKSDQRLIGRCGIHVDDAAVREGNVSYEVNPVWWNRGFASEAAAAMLEFGFSQLGLLRIRACCIEDNLASRRVLEKLGMRLEMRAPVRVTLKGREHAQLVYAVYAASRAARTVANA
jgi:RimJ/RimL family protein N-acetyltransferase